MAEDIEQIAMDAEEVMKKDGYKLIETIEVSMDLKYNLLLLKNLRYLLKLLKQKS